MTTIVQQQPRKSLAAISTTKNSNFDIVQIQPPTGEINGEPFNFKNNEDDEEENQKEEEEEEKQKEENKEENKKYLKNCVNEEIKKLDKNIEEMDKVKGNTIQKLKFIEEYKDKVYNPIKIVNEKYVKEKRKF